MGWADRAIVELQAGRETVIRPRGSSMQPKVRSGARVTIRPVADPASLCKGDIVLVTVGRSQYLHLISAADASRVQISNSSGRVNGWVPRRSVHGIAVRIDNASG